MVTYAHEQGPLSFGSRLMAAELELLRAHLTQIFSSRIGARISVDTLPGVMAPVKAAGFEIPSRAPALYLILDTARIYLFHDSGRPNDPSLRSLVAFLADGHAATVDSDDHGRASYFGFPFQLAALDLTVQCMAELRPCHYCCLNLVSGDISFARLFPHPSTLPPKIVAPSSATSPANAPNIRSIRTDSTLRTPTTLQLGDLAEEAAGIIRGEISHADAASLAAATTTVALERGRHTERCHGRALTPRQALNIARCEAVERFQVGYPPPGIELVFGSYGELADVAIDPATLFIGTDASSSAAGDKPIRDIPISWTWAWAIAQDRWRLVPAQDIWFRIPEVSHEPRLVACTTSGCSLGATLEEAAIFAAFELIERDAFLTAWYLKRPAILIEPVSAQGELARMLIERFHWAFPNYRLVMLDLTSDIGIPTVGGYAFRAHSEGPCVYAAAATHLDPEQAFSKALKDLMGFRPESFEASQGRRSRLETHGPTAHFQRFASEAALSEFGYLQLESAEHIEVNAIGTQARSRHALPLCEEMQLDSVLHHVANTLRAAGSQLYMTDITHPFLRDRSLAAARAIAPGLYPLWFGSRAKRFAITDRLRALALIYTGSRLDPESLRLTPHPLS